MITRRFLKPPCSPEVGFDRPGPLIRCAMCWLGKGKSSAIVRSPTTLQPRVSRFLTGSISSSAIPPARAHPQSQHRPKVRKNSGYILRRDKSPPKYVTAQKLETLSLLADLSKQATTAVPDRLPLMMDRRYTRLTLVVCSVCLPWKLDLSSVSERTNGMLHFTG